MSIVIKITEQQRRKLILEKSDEEMSDVTEKNFEFAKKIIEKSSTQIGFDLRFLVTWGASIGGFIGPLNDFINDKFPEFSDMDITLILIGVISSYYVDNKKLIIKIFDKIKERGIVNEFKKVLSKADDLKSAFISFVESLNITLHKVTNILSYAFIIPLIPMLYNLAKEGMGDGEDVKEIAKRVLSFGILTVSGVLVRELITKILKRFGSKKNED